MIRKVIIKNFKLFEQVPIELGTIVLLAGPNNTGKSTVLQAIAVFELAFKKWLAERGSASKAKTRTGVPMTRQEFSAIPLREMNLIWHERRTALGGPRPTAGRPRFIEIELIGEDQARGEWAACIKIQYAGSEMIYIRPAEQMSENVLSIIQSLNIVHIPPFSGLETEEPRRDKGYQNILIGQGRPGEILRNLLWEIYKSSPESWNELCNNMAYLFGYKLEQPKYVEGQPYIVCEYLPGLPQRGMKRLPKLDIANAGSGFHQVLLLLAFFYARPASVLLLDEPDAHLHFILQKEIFDLLEKIAMKRNCQLIVATHSEALLDDHEPNGVISFTGKQPRVLADTVERNQIREALKKVTTTELLKAHEVGAVLYIESDSDYKLLREWAQILKHKKSLKFLERPFIHPLWGKSLHEAKEHFFALKACHSSIKGLCILDGDNKDSPDEEFDKQGLRVLRWKRYEIENYLIHPDPIKRYIDFPLSNHIVDEFFRQEFPPNIDFFGEHNLLVVMKASTQYLIPLLERAQKPTPKKHLYLIAHVMQEKEIHPEVRGKLDEIAQLVS